MQESSSRIRLIKLRSCICIVITNLKSMEFSNRQAFKKLMLNVSLQNELLLIIYTDQIVLRNKYISTDSWCEKQASSCSFLFPLTPSSPGALPQEPPLPPLPSSEATTWKITAREERAPLWFGKVVHSDPARKRRHCTRCHNTKDAHIPKKVTEVLAMAWTVKRWTWNQKDYWISVVVETDMELYPRIARTLV